MSAPVLLSSSFASDDERARIDPMLAWLGLVNVSNRDAQAYYDGSYVAQDFGISIPPNMRALQTVAGWSGTVVDVLEERLDWLGWSSNGGDYGLREIYAANALESDSGMAHLDALIFGVSFVVVGAGFEDEPSPLITDESPMGMTADWDRRRRRISSAIRVDEMEMGEARELTLFGPDETTSFEFKGGMWSVTNRDQHKMGRVPVVLFPNRARRSRDFGRSEITRAVRYYTDAAARTLKGLEVNREFYNAPQRIALNVDESMFQDEAGNTVSSWQSIQGRVWSIPANDDGMPAPDVKQFAPASPAPYVDQVRGYAQLLAAEAGIPGAYLGFETANPTSADAIRAGEARLVKRAERRQSTFGRAWLEVARLALMVRDGEVPEDFDDRISTHWRDAATPTRAASADEATKLISSGILPADSSVTYDRVGLSPAEQRIVESDKRRAGGSAALQAIRDAANRQRGVVNDAGDDSSI